MVSDERDHRGSESASGCTYNPKRTCLVGHGNVVLVNVLLARIKQNEEDGDPLKNMCHFGP